MSTFTVTSDTNTTATVVTAAATTFTIDGGLRGPQGLPGGPEASTTVKGIVQLTGDLGGTSSAPTTPTAVHLTGDETISGAKTFNGTVIVPTPTISTHAATKAYADTKAIDTDVVHDTGDETVAGVKTFTSAPVIAGQILNTTTSAGQGIQLRKQSTGTGDQAILGKRISTTAGTVNAVEWAAQRVNTPNNGDTDAVVRVTAAGVLTEMMRLSSTKHVIFGGTIDPRVTTLADGATITPNINTTDMAIITLVANRNIGAPDGTPSSGQLLRVRIKYAGAFSPTWNAIYRFTGGSAPTATATLDKTDYFDFVYNVVDTKWDCVNYALNL